MTDSTDFLLKRRQQTHGDYVARALLAQTLKQVLQGIPAWDNNLNAHQQHSLEMICDKISRILYGDPNFAEHWDDIAGYARLIAKIIQPDDPANLLAEAMGSPAYQPEEAPSTYVVRGTDA